MAIFYRDLPGKLGKKLAYRIAAVAGNNMQVRAIEKKKALKTKWPFQFSANTDVIAASLHSHSGLLLLCTLTMVSFIQSGDLG